MGGEVTSKGNVLHSSVIEAEYCYTRAAILTEKRIADELGDLISRLARFGEVQQLATEHALELLYAQNSRTPRDGVSEQMTKQ